MRDYENKLMSSKISIHEHNIMLFDYLRKKYEFFSLDEWKNFVFMGNLKIDGKVVQDNTTLKLGSQVDLNFRQSMEPAVNKNFEIVYEDDDLLVINKPFNLPMHPSGRYYGNTLINIVKKKYATDDLWLANRLDRDTSGLCIVCKNKESLLEIQEQFFWNKVKKVYSVIVIGNVENDNFTVNKPLKEINKATPNKRVVVDKFGKESQTRFQLVENGKFSIYNGNIKYYYPYSILKAYPIHGRTHQIRVHIADAGFPIINDKIYNEKFCILNSPMFLRCIELKFRHPKKGEMDFKVEEFTNKLLQF